MSENSNTGFSLYNAADAAFSEGQKRQLAVEAALALIYAEAMGGGASVNTLFSNMKELASFADRIQRALQV